MAMAGSAVGLGNIWRFPYIVGEYGGAAFILVYIVSTIILSLPVFLSEALIGRRSRSNTFGAMDALAPGSGWKWVGLVTVISPLVLLSYYSVVGGWSVEYLLKSLAFDFTGVPDEELSGVFGNFISSTWTPVVMHTVFLLMVAGIILGGVKKGIERFSKITMPILFVLIVVITGYSVSLPGSGDGVRYLLKPDWSRLSIEAVAAAIGQSFYSLSLGVGSILTYASYVRRDENLVASSAGTAVSDLLFAILAGFAIMPAVFAAGIAPGSGPGLVFETLPFIFNKMGGAIPFVGAVVAILFFLTILVAALTSAISMMEVGVAYLCEEKGMSRFAATSVLFAVIWAVGTLCSLSFGPLSGLKIFGCTLFEFFDKLCSNFLMVFGGLLFTIFVGWRMSREDVRDEITSGGRYSVRIFPVLWFLIRYAAPVAVIIIFVTNLII